MADRALRGMRLGTQSMETAAHAELAERVEVHYDCPNGHVLTFPFSVEADIPLSWECHCGALALLLAQLGDDGGTMMGGKEFVLLPAVAGLMFVVGVLAAVGPARRGLSVQPTEALREE